MGHVAALSGPDKAAGLQAAHGINLALEEVNKDAAVRIEVRHTDTQGKIDTYETQAIRLLALNQVRALLGGTNLEEVLRLDAAVPPETKDQPLFLPIISPYGRRTRELSKQVILTGMTPQAQGKVLARYAATELNVTQIAVLVDQGSERAQMLAEAFQREFAEAGKKEPLKLSYGTDVKRADFKLADRLSQLSAEMPRAVLVAGSKGDLRQVFDALKQQADKAKQPLPNVLYGGEDGSLRPSEWSLLPRKTGDGGVYLASAFGLEKDNAVLEEFAGRYRKQFQEEPDVHAALAYEGMKLLADALQRAPESAPKLRDELFKIKDFPGLAGPLNLDSDQVITRSLYILRMDQGQMTVMKKFAP